MPSKEDVCVLQNSVTNSYLSSEVEELVAAIKHNFQLKSKPSHTVFSKHRRMAPYSAPVRSVCRKENEFSTDHSSPNCKYCILRSKSSKSNNNSDDPYEILTLLSKGILISEAVKRLQMDVEHNRTKKMDFYDSSEEVDDVDRV